MIKPEKRRMTPEVAKRIAEIVGLDVDEERAARLAPQIQALRDGVNTMDEIDLSDVEPASVSRPAQG